MKVITATKARENIYGLITDVNEESTPIIINNSRGDSAVMLSMKDWEAIQETLYLNSIPGMTDSIIAAAKEPLEDGSEYEEGEEW